MQNFTRKTYLVTLFVLMTVSLKAQIDQHGIVVEWNSGGKTMSNVSIEVPSAKDANPKRSDSRGEFIMHFAEHKDGNVICGIHVKKEGYDVVNHKDTQKWTLTTDRDLKIVMAPKGKLEEARIDYYIKSETACLARYDSTMAFLDRQYALNNITATEYQYWKGQAEDELIYSYRKMDEYADIFARINTDDMDYNEELIHNRLMFNDVEGAIAIVEGDSYVSVLQAYNNFSTAYPMSFEMEMVASTDSVNVDTTENDIPEDIKNSMMIFQTNIDLIENEFGKDNQRYAKYCLYLGILYKKYNMYAASEMFFKKALKMYELMEIVDGKDYSVEIEKINSLK